MQRSHQRVSLSKEALAMLERNRDPHEDRSAALIRIIRERENKPAKPLKKDATAVTIIKVTPEKDNANDTGILEW